MSEQPGMVVVPRRKEERSEPSLEELARLFLKLGTIGFGGPAAHIAMMEDEVVKRRRWLNHQEFLDLLGATNLIPGPNSTEMAIHIGLVRAGWKENTRRKVENASGMDLTSICVRSLSGKDVRSIRRRCHSTTAFLTTLPWGNRRLRPSSPPSGRCFHRRSNRRPEVFSLG